MMERAGRILLVTAGLGVAGAVLGAVASIGALTILILVPALIKGTGLLLDAEVLWVAGVVGAAFGVVLGPLTAWIALRRVPLGRALITTTVGTTVGAVLGSPLPFGSLLGAVAGFLLAAFWLRRRTSVSEPTASSHGV